MTCNILCLYKWSEIAISRRVSEINNICENVEGKHIHTRKYICIKYNGEKNITYITWIHNIIYDNGSVFCISIKYSKSMKRTVAKKEKKCNVCV